MALVLVALGGALGSILRYLAQGRVFAQFPIPFPLGTLAVNLVGSLLIGGLAALFEALPLTALSAHLRHFLIIGILGGFTTFSSYSLECLNLVRSGDWRLAVLYVLASNGLGLLLAFAGFAVGRMMLRSV